MDDLWNELLELAALLPQPSAGEPRDIFLFHWHLDRAFDDRDAEPIRDFYTIRPHGALVAPEAPEAIRRHALLLGRAAATLEAILRRDPTARQLLDSLRSSTMWFEIEAERAERLLQAESL